MKVFFIALFALLALLQYRLWAGPHGIPEYVARQDNIQLQLQSNEKLKERNQALREDIIDLKQGSEAIEERARHELGMVKQGETFYRLFSPAQPQAPDYQ